MALSKLNLRDFFWLAVVVAMALGWWLDRSRLAGEIEARQQESAFSFFIGASR